MQSKATKKTLKSQLTDANNKLQEVEGRLTSLQIAFERYVENTSRELNSMKRDASEDRLFIAEELFEFKKRINRPGIFKWLFNRKKPEMTVLNPGHTKQDNEV